jgi:predicted membrane GTPase involved in stress response
MVDRYPRILHFENVPISAVVVVKAIDKEANSKIEFVDAVCELFEYLGAKLLKPIYAKFVDGSDPISGKDLPHDSPMNHTLVSLAHRIAHN